MNDGPQTRFPSNPPIAPDPAPSAPPAPRSRPPRSRRVGLTAVLALCLASAVGGGVATAGALGGAPAVAAPAAVTAGVDQASATAPATAAELTAETAPASLVSDIAKKVGPAVVAIVTSSTVPTSTGFSMTGAGSGVIVDPSGLILTNRHVVGDGMNLTVYLADGRELPGTLEGVDTLTDLALLSVDASDLPAATLGESSNVEVGGLAVAIGNPEGDLPGSVTAGIVSALERQIVVTDQYGMNAPKSLRHLIQHDAAINPGNSGGPLVGSDGSVIAINTAMAGGSQGIGFAIPIDLAKPIIKQVLAGEPIRRPYFGIYFTEIDAQVAQDQGLPVDSGVLVKGDAAAGQPGVISGGPADQAGLQEGDILTAIDGQPIDATHQLDVTLLQHEPGDQVELTVLRGDQTLKVTVTLGIRPADIAQ